jgi:DnaJ-class molecular chaperone
MTAIPVIIGIFAAWTAFLYVSPFGRCWRCHGRGVVIRGKRASKCRRCHGARRQQRFGSRTVHRAVRMVRAERDRTRKEKEASARERHLADR